MSETIPRPYSEDQGVCTLLPFVQRGEAKAEPTTQSKVNTTKATVPPRPNLVKEDNTIIKFAVVVFTLLAYSLLHTCYNIYYEDDSWTMSNAWNFINLGVDNDLLFLDQDGAFTGQLFGKIYFFISGSFLNLVGWTKGNVYLFNSALIFLSAFFWYHILKTLNFKSQVVELLPLMMPIFPPCFFAAHTGRTDAFALTMMSLGFLLFVRKYYVMAGLIAILAIETHIMGLVGLFYFLAYFIYLQDFKKLEDVNIKSCFQNSSTLIYRTTAGMALGILTYALLHHQVFSLSELQTIIQTKSDMVSPVNNYILAYFTDFDWYYHLPEFGLLAFSTYLYISNKFYRDNKLVFLLLVILLASTFLTRRENRTYFIYLVPAILIMYFYTYDRLDKIKPFIVASLMIFMGYYASLYHHHKDFKFNDFVSFVNANTSEKDLPIVGMPDVWFAALDREYYPIHNERDFNKINLSDFYLVETDYLSRRSRRYNDVKDNIHQNYDCEVIEEWTTYQNNKATVCHCKNDGIPNEKIEYKPYPGWQKMMQKFMPASIM